MGDCFSHGTTERLKIKIYFLCALCEATAKQLFRYKLFVCNELQVTQPIIMLQSPFLYEFSKIFFGISFI